MVPPWIFEQTTKPALQPVVDYVVGLINDGLARIPEEWAARAAEEVAWIMTYDLNIARLMVCILLTVIVGFVSFYVIGGAAWLVYQWATPQRQQLDSSLQVSFNNQYKGLL